MSLFVKELAIDLGTANTIIMYDGKVVVNEPSLIAINATDNSTVAVGREAVTFIDRGLEDVRVFRPIRGGVVTDCKLCARMLRGMIDRCSQLRKSVFQSMRVYVAVPSDRTDSSVRSAVKTCRMAGARRVYPIDKSIAAAIGLGVNVQSPDGNMIIDMGAATTEIAVFTLGKIVVHKSIPVSGEACVQDVVEYMARMHHLRINALTAERIITRVGSALPELADASQPYTVNAPNSVTSLPMKVPVGYEEIAHCLDKELCRLEMAVLKVLDSVSPQLYDDICRRGIYLTGGGALLCGLAKRLEDKLRLPIRVSDKPMLSVAKGLDHVRWDRKTYSWAEIGR